MLAILKSLQCVGRLENGDDDVLPGDTSQEPPCCEDVTKRYSIEALLCEWFLLCWPGSRPTVSATFCLGAAGLGRHHPAIIVPKKKKKKKK